MALFTQFALKWKLKPGQNLSDINLSGKKLACIDLRFTSFFKALFIGTDLRGANFSKANLTLANFKNAILADANLSGADLTHANFENADLSNADLSNSELFGTIFDGANLQGANLMGAKIGNTFFRNANLRSALLPDFDGQFVYLSRTVMPDGSIEFPEGNGLDK